MTGPQRALEALLEAALAAMGTAVLIVALAVFWCWYRSRRAWRRHGGDPSAAPADPRAAQRRATGLALAAAAACVLLLVWLAAAAQAHRALPTAEQPDGWEYPTWCCAEEHCRPAIEGEVTAGSGCWLVTTPGLAPEFLRPGDVDPATGQRKVRPSRDYRFHVCRYPDQESPVRCLLPPLGF